MRRTLATMAAAAVMLGGGVAAATPSQAASITTGPLAYCLTEYMADCGGYLRAPLPWYWVPETERDSDFAFALRTKKGKRVPLALMSSENIGGTTTDDIVSGINMTEDYFDDGTTLHDNGPNVAALFQYPRGLKPGKYKLTMRIRASGYWDCSITYHDGCRWNKPYKWTKTKTVKLRTFEPVAFL